jgi:hypothetical protein
VETGKRGCRRPPSHAESAWVRHSLPAFASRSDDFYLQLHVILTAHRAASSKHRPIV